MENNMILATISSTESPWSKFVMAKTNISLDMNIRIDYFVFCLF